MAIKISKKEWEEFLKWKESKEKPKEESEKEEKLEIEDDISDLDISEILEEEEEEYICPNCGYKSNKPFERCPVCGVKLRWD